MAALTRFCPPLFFLTLVAAVTLTGCSTTSSSGDLLGFIAPYRMEVVQGNIVTRDMVAQLRPGLTADQVRTLLGAPLLADVFHANRWDYVFTIRRQGTSAKQRRVTVFFENERVSRFEADDVPTEREFVASIDASKPESRKIPLELDEQQLRAIPVPPPGRAALTPGVAASGPVRSYPPLETSVR
jgi:outer membrane protein assembly factor BamE